MCASAPLYFLVMGLKHEKQFSIKWKRALHRKGIACKCMHCIRQTDLRHVDAALLEWAVVGIVGAHVAVFAPVAWKGAIHTGETPIKRRQQEKECYSIINSKVTHGCNLSNHDISTLHTTQNALVTSKNTLSLVSTKKNFDQTCCCLNRGLKYREV